MKPADLDDPTPVEPDDALLERVVARGGAFRRRRRVQRWAGIGTSVLVVVVAVAIALSRGTSSGTKPATHGTTTTTVPTVTAAQLAGPWRLVRPRGHHVGRPGTVTLDGSGHLTGDDGCNDISGTYRVEGRSTTFRVVELTDVLCRPTPPLLTALREATRAELRQGHLVLLAKNGRELAELVRAVVTAHIELPSNTMRAGSDMKGRLVIDNETGRVIKATGCGSLFAVALTNATYKPSIAWLSCLQRIDVGTGVSRYPIDVSARTQSCTNGPPTGGIPTCSPPNSPPPLAPGHYEAKLYQSTHIVPDPPPIRIEVISP